MKEDVPIRVLESGQEVDLEDKRRPSGKGGDDSYFWKMTQDKRFIEVIFPVPDDVDKEDIIYRMGEDSFDARRGPTLVMGYSYRDDEGIKRENHVIDGQILNKVTRERCMWTLEEMGGVKVVILTLARPTMTRKQHDSVIQKTFLEERIEPQTWDAVLLEERVMPKVGVKAFIDFSIEDDDPRRMEIGLYDNVVPNTVENFLCILTGEVCKEDGKIEPAATCLKGQSLDHCKEEHMIAMGNGGIDTKSHHVDQELLEELSQYVKDKKAQRRAVGFIAKDWFLRWGQDLGNPICEVSGYPKMDGEPTNMEEDYEVICEKLQELVDRGEGADLIFFKQGLERGISAMGDHFPAENFKALHTKKGVLTMDRDQTADVQGSSFFITLKEFPELDGKYVAFGEVIKGYDILELLDEEYDDNPDAVVVSDCGILFDAEPDE